MLRWVNYLGYSLKAVPKMSIIRESVCEISMKRDGVIMDNWEFGGSDRVNTIV
jgi:hypothetical protein